MCCVSLVTPLHPSAVEMAKTAIRVCKEQRLPPTTFIPADVRFRVQGRMGRAAGCCSAVGGSVLVQRWAWTRLAAGLAAGCACQRAARTAALPRHVDRSFGVNYLFRRHPQQGRA